MNVVIASVLKTEMMSKRELKRRVADIVDSHPSQTMRVIIYSVVEPKAAQRIK